MKRLAFNLIFLLILIVSMASGALAATMGDYTSIPPFLATGVRPNLLLMIDNSASMYDLAYVNDQKYCYDDSYNPSSSYAGYFAPTTWYQYDATDGQFESTTEAAATTFCDSATGTKYSNAYVRITINEAIDPKVVTAFAATGNFLNWATASKLDIEKKILTGGKYEAAGTYGAPNGRLVMESRGCLNKRFLKQVTVSSGGTDYALPLGVRPPQEESFPAWTVGTAYAVGDIVMDLGYLYIATSAGTSTNNGVADDGGVTWAAYTLTRWTDGATYPANSIVSDNGEMYITAAGGTASGTGVADDAGITDWVGYHTTQIEIFEVTTDGFDNSGCQSALEEVQKDSPNQGQLKSYIDSCMGYTEGESQGSANAALNHSVHNCWYESKNGSWPPGNGPVQNIKPTCQDLYGTGLDPWEIETDHEGYPCFGVWDADPANQQGYVGRCWKPGEGSFQCTKYHPQHPEGSADAREYCQKWEWVGDDGPTWDAAGYADVDTCIETALMDYCGILEIPEVVDPTDQAGETGEFWNIPAVLIDSGVVAQRGESLLVLKGYIAQSTAPTGLIQEYAGDIRMGAMSFNDDGSKSECAQPDPYILYNCADAANRDGGQIIADIGSDSTALASSLNAIEANSWTPMAEAMYNAIGYYTQNSACRLDVNDFSIGASYDPVTAWCQANNILIITDGASTTDLATAVSTLTAVAGQNDGDTDAAECGSLSGSSLLDDLAYYAKNGSIYPAGQEQLNGEDKQNITTYIVAAGTLRSTGEANECSPEVLLQAAASNAGTSLYQAENLADLEDRLRDAFEAIIGGASSGTAASVVSAARRGEGALYQAVFFQTYEDSEGTEINWIGQLHAMLVDQYGNMREDSNGNHALDLTSDKIIELFFDATSGRTKARRDTDSDGDGEADGSPVTIDLSDINYLWEAGRALAERTASTRDIYTWIDKDNDGVVDGGGTLDSNEYITFKSDNASDLRPYLAVETSGTTETTKLTNYICGTDQAGYRSRTIDIDGTDRVWKLGDIVYSTPSLVGKPKENYELIYSDTSYKTFKSQYNNRRNVVYVGANDGTLHAFNAGFYDEADSEFETGTSIPSYSSAVPSLGEELWAYIPYNLLPHLRWLAEDTYSHVCYVDLKPKVIDAKIFTADAVHPEGWGTVLVCGMRFGGGTIELSESDVNYDWDGDSTIEAGVSRAFRSAYFALDVTNPEAPPTLLWEFTDANLGFTTSYPAVVFADHTNNDWWVAFGSGPTDYDGTSDQLGRTYVLKLLTGAQPNNSPIQTNWGAGHESFMGEPMSVDVDISTSQCSEGNCSYSPDVFYIGDTQGTLWRISCIGGNWAGTQTTVVSLGSTKPITSAPSASQDDNGRLWIYFGTGRFFDDADKENTDTQSLVGVKEPLDWSDCDSDSNTTELTIYCGSCASAASVQASNLLDVTDYAVFEGGYVDNNGDGSSDVMFDALVEDIEQFAAETAPRHYDGWILDLTGGERCISKPTVLGGIISFSTFEPDDDLCAFEGESSLYALYYKTGTAYYENIIGYGTDTITVTEGGSQIEKTEISRAVCLGEGVAATPSLHVGTEQGAKAIVQISTGEILVIEEENLPEGYRSRPLHWIQSTD